MGDDSDDKDSKRKSRNLSEKKRRDQFNQLVNELSLMVSTNNKKMDKSTVLKSSILFLKTHNDHVTKSKLNEIQEDWKPAFLTNEEFSHLFLEAVDGFILVFATSGEIRYVSENVTSLIGYLPSEILNLTIYELAIDEERNYLHNILMGQAAEQQTNTQVTFSVHLKRRLEYIEGSGCELVQFIGYFRPDEDTDQCDDKSCGASEETETSRIVFVGTGKLQIPQLIKEMPLITTNRIEFVSRHSLEWKFLFLDHRAPSIIGYLPFEVLGTSGYEYYHIDDIDKVVNCHESLMKKGEGTSCYYRFLTKGQQWIWLQTRFYITYHQWNSKPEFVVCKHRVANHIDVIKQMSNNSNQNQSEVASSSSSTTWTERNSSKKKPEEPNNISMSADSPASLKSSAKRGQQSECADTLSQSSRQSNQFQADLQRKQAELQAIIGFQQQELRRVSEQLIMARLGIYSQNQSPSRENQSFRTKSTLVSSTTMPVSSNKINVSSVPEPTTTVSSITTDSAVLCQESKVLCNTPDSNTQIN